MFNKKADSNSVPHFRLRDRRRFALHLLFQKGAPVIHEERWGSAVILTQYLLARRVFIIHFVGREQ
eukprot:4286959-Lingulodinium_polyedra.AAC.1